MKHIAEQFEFPFVKEMDSENNKLKELITSHLDKWDLESIISDFYKDSERYNGCFIDIHEKQV